jgi:hypothetical protein
MSIDQGPNVDLNLVLQGGQAFLDRVQQLKDAQAGAEQARADLGIGKNVIELRDAASRALSEAQEQAAAIKDEAMQKAATAAKASGEWVKQTRDETAADRLAAAQLRAEAETLNKNAKENHAASVAKLAEAEDKLSKATAAHQAVQAAQAALKAAL